MVSTSSGFILTIKSRPKHGLLYEMSKRHGTINELAANTGLCASYWVQWINLRSYPRSAFATRSKKDALYKERIEEILQREIGTTLDECWPQEVRTFIDNTSQIKSLVFEQTAEVPLARLSQAKPSSLMIEHDPIHNLNHEELKNAIGDALGTLTPIERDVIKLRYGFDGPSFTLRDVASMLDRSTERIRQIENKAIRKMAQPKRAVELAGFLD